eukprot:m.1422798 g.1422798  ORF g.1422798 m.1422798 type:complete len:760 (+) comp25054_c1_seq9:286-2565(+)
MVEPAAVEQRGILASHDFSALRSAIWPVATGARKLTSMQQVWFNQGFEWSALHPCFLVQHKNGPCGILAPIQALVVQTLLFPVDPTQPPAAPIGASEIQRDEAFIHVVASTLWRARVKDVVSLIVPVPKEPEERVKDMNPGMGFQDQLHFDQHSYFIHTASSEDEARGIVSKHLPMLQSNVGVVMLLYSIVWSRGVNTVCKEMDATSLIEEDFGCCEQAVVNMILSGRACSSIDSDVWSNEYLLVGFLTVEDLYFPALCFQNPAYPVWVVHGGGHYSMLWTATPSVLERTAGSGSGFVTPPPPSMPDSPPELMQISPITTAQNPDDSTVPSGTGADPLSDARPDEGLDISATPIVRGESEGSDPDELARALALSMQTHGAGGHHVPNAPSVATLPLPEIPSAVFPTQSHVASSGTRDAGHSSEHPVATMHPRDVEEEEYDRAIALSLEQHAADTASDVACPAAKKARKSWSPVHEQHRQDDQQAISGHCPPVDTSPCTPRGQQMMAAPASHQPPSHSVGDARFVSLAQTAADARRVLSVDYDEQIQQALALSLQDAHGPVTEENAAGAGDAAVPVDGAPRANVFFFHYNGLQPPYARAQPPAPVVIEVNLDGITLPVADEHSQMEQVNQARKIRNVLTRQRIPAHDMHDAYEYLVACAPDGSMEIDRTPRRPGKWYCRDCNAVQCNFQAYNEDNAVICKVCFKDISECGYCHWVTADMLPAAELRRQLSEHAPQIVQLLRRRWPLATLHSPPPLPKLWG